MSDSERDARTCAQWLQSVRAYLEFRAGTTWRHYADRNEDYWAYVGAIRCLNDLDFGSSNTASLPAASPVPISSEEKQLAARSNTQLVDELMRLNPGLTMRRSLLHFQKTKLIHMVVHERELSKRFPVVSESLESSPVRMEKIA